ncbi:MAG: acyl-CoA thioesterase [Anaerolineales bacterium]|nr:acyl-CoA thioesterase [Anaerolineales bacterium]
MPLIKFFHPIEVRYGDLDPQGHLNNAKYLTYFEQARSHYLLELKLFKVGQSFLEIGMIMAEARVTFHAPVLWGLPVKVGVGTTRLGHKSFNVAQTIVNAETSEVLASGEVILVAYDYYAEKTIRIPDDWRRKISRFEGLE